MNIVQITDLEREELRPFRTLRRPREHFAEGIFVGEGERVFDRMLSRGVEVLSVLLTPDWFSAKRPDLERSAPHIPVFVAEHAILESIVGFHLHQGIMALGRRPETPGIEQLLENAPHPRLLLALDGLANAENVGVIVRNAVAFGVSGLIVGETSSSPYLRRAVRNSMGAVFSLPLTHSDDLVRDLRALRTGWQTRVVALETAPGSVPIQTCDLSGDVCLVLGSEGEGISPAVRAVCDTCVEIPMHAGVDSLNVANASAVALYEARRQRRVPGPATS
jgi:tRNA G18 (ribose-2'-O)-methylase SpoU